MGARHWCFRGTASAVSPSGGCPVALLGAVDGGASDTEQVGQFGGAVLTGLEQADQMCFLPGVELGLLAAQPTLGLRYLHPFWGAQPNQVGLELRDHGQHVKQQPGTTYQGDALDALRVEGYPVSDEAAANLTPAQHDNINFYGTDFFDVETELRREGHRPLRSPAA